MKSRGLKLGAAVLSLMVLSLGLGGFKPVKLTVESGLVMNVSGDVPETVPYNPLWGLFEPTPMTFLDKVMLLKKASADKNLKAAVIVIRSNNLGMARTQELRDAIAEFQKSGKSAVCYLEMESDSDLAYYLATACDKVYVAPSSFLDLNGLSNFYFFLGGLFSKVKLSIQVVKIKEYKTAGDMLFRRDMSPEHREMAESLLNSMWDQYLSDLAAARKKSKDEIIALINSNPVLPEKYREAGMIDGVKYLDEILDELKAGAKGMEVVQERDYLTIPAEALGVNVGPKVAVIFGVGNIVNEDPGGSPFMGSIMSAERTVKELEAAAKDDSIKAVVFRVDSDGGSALASDLIWRATRKVREKKPLVVSMGDVAGSGGYYVACGADAIVAEPATLTGSIGVVSAHIAAKYLLSWLQIGTVSMSRGTYADMGDISRPWTDGEVAKANESIDGIYQLFLERVSAGRKKSKDEINKIGRGRVWTGAQAKEKGLVDELGGINRAVSIVKTKLGAKDVNLVYKRKPISLWKLLTGKVEEEMVYTMVGPQSREMKMGFEFNRLYQEGETLFLMDAIKVE